MLIDIVDTATQDDVFFIDNDYDACMGETDLALITLGVDVSCPKTT